MRARIKKMQEVVAKFCRLLVTRPKNVHLGLIPGAVQKLNLEVKMPDGTTVTIELRDILTIDKRMRPVGFTVLRETLLNAYLEVPANQEILVRVNSQTGQVRLHPDQVGKFRESITPATDATIRKIKNPPGGGARVREKVATAKK